MKGVHIQVCPEQPAPFDSQKLLRTSERCTFFAFLSAHLICPLLHLNACETDVCFRSLMHPVYLSDEPGRLPGGASSRVDRAGRHKAGNQAPLPKLLADIPGVLRNSLARDGLRGERVCLSPIVPPVYVVFTQYATAAVVLLPFQADLASLSACPELSPHLAVKAP